MKKKLFILLLIYVLYATGGWRQRSDKYANDSMTGIEAVVKKKSNINEKENKSIIAIGEADVVESEKSEDENGVKDRPHIKKMANDIEEKESDDTMIVQGEEREVIENPYFPAKEHVPLKVHAQYYNRGFVDEIADAEINRIKIYEEGSIYKLKIYIVPTIHSWYFVDNENMSMYFYVMADKIYWILPYTQLEPGGKTINFYDDDDMLVKTLDTDEKLQSIGVLRLVCQEKDICEEAFYITQEENRITYHSSETKPNGEPGGEDLFVWKKGKGLVEFGIGFGPGPMDVHIDEIYEVTEDE